jgi:UDP-N-acetylmuramate dehydrogenase
MSFAPAILRHMNILQSVKLADYSTMRLGGTATYAVEIHDRTELTEALSWAEAQHLPVMTVGGGSNIIWRDEGFNGLLLINAIKRFELFNEDETNVYVTVGAGENWDSVVARTVEAGASGIEALSLIPGTAGATPVQNVGAYGQEIADTLVSVEAYDTVEKRFLTIPNMDCAFGYRTSRFKTTDKGRFLITALTLHLTRGNPEPPFYGSVQQYFIDRNITEVTPQVLRDAVIDIRSQKLPDPAKVANNGSFFANPVIDTGLFAQINADYDNVPHWETKDGRIKVPAAWLIEQAGFKDIHDTETGMGTWPTQPLVLVNEHATSTSQLLAFRQKIIDTVKAKFDITLEQEPEILP